MEDAKKVLTRNPIYMYKVSHKITTQKRADPGEPQHYTLLYTTLSPILSYKTLCEFFLSSFHSTAPSTSLTSSSFSPNFTTENLIILGSRPSVLRMDCCTGPEESKRMMKW